MADTTHELYPAEPAPSREWLHEQLQRLPLKDEERELILAVATHASAIREGHWLNVCAAPAEIAAALDITDRHERRLRAACVRYGVITFAPDRSGRASRWRIDMQRLIEAPPAAEDLRLPVRRHSHDPRQRSLFDAAESQPAAALAEPVDGGSGASLAAAGDADVGRPSVIVRALGCVALALGIGRFRSGPVRTCPDPKPVQVRTGPDTGPDIASADDRAEVAPASAETPVLSDQRSGPDPKPGYVRTGPDLPHDRLSEREIDYLSINPSSISAARARLPDLPAAVWQPELSPERVCAAVRVWFRDHRLRDEGFEPDEVLGAILAARKADRTSPQDYVETCLANGVRAHWVQRAKRLRARVENLKVPVR
jgi:hypothetical protein